ncbi:S41 family peptidase [Pedobacter metabolipauper]|uniref:Peptidase S41-like protein n=1 Tax=Pedobacter metabolipauper TaxID=425513 RepID=A0A4R6SSF4_9SPHI|nr:S41 family peptidase [Pedobacter metabolipauper]TDQ06711.1 peptidase S41-like protein [Pedobacter metabolipauper]
MNNRNIYQLIISILMIGALGSCKKDAHISDDTDPVISPATGTRMQFTLDSIFLYARQIYLWNEVLPDYNTFNPRVKYDGMASDLSAFKKELFDISQLKLNTATGLPFELPVTAGNPKYSNLLTGRSIPGSSAEAGPATGSVILKSLMVNPGANSAAYIALGSFPLLSTVKPDLDRVFSEFAAASPQNLIIDLRSNAGGYVETAEYIADLTAPSALTGKVMFTEQFNALMQGGKATILKYQPYLDNAGKPIIYKGRNTTMADVDYTEAGNTFKFNKKGNLETIKNIYFIVSPKTASASELLINSLKPYFNVRLIGEKTYGKPVGFFGINIDKYSVYLPSFLILNAQGKADYFDGITPDVFVKGESNPTLGDPNEGCLSKVLDLINGIPVTMTSTPTADKKISAVNQNTGLIATGQDPVKTLGLIEHRQKLKP